VSQRATVGRILHVYSPLWTGPQPGIVVGGPWGEGADGAPDQQRASVNVLLDGLNHQSALEMCRKRGEGNTFASVPVYQQAPKNTDDVIWAVFPPRAEPVASARTAQVTLLADFAPGEFVIIDVGDVLGQVEDVAFRYGNAGKPAYYVVSSDTNGLL
jgi:hypothetical protein